MYLGEYQFNKLHQEIVRKTPKKKKLDEWGKEVIVAQGLNIVWKISN